MKNKSFGSRRSIRMKGYDYSSPGRYFITIVTEGRKPLFGTIVRGQVRLSEYGRIVVKCWKQLEEKNDHVRLGAFVVMPDHIHGILILLQRSEEERRKTISKPKIAGYGKMVPGSISILLRTFKSAVTKRINNLQNTPGERVWQRNYHDRIIRTDKELWNKYAYIRNNPLKHG